MRNNSSSRTSTGVIQQPHTDGNGNNYFACPSHPAFLLTNVCVHPQCLEPLCQECLPRHLELHQESKLLSQIQNIQIVRSQQKERFLNYQKSLHSLYTLGNGGLFLHQYIDEHTRQIEDIRKNLLNVINTYIDTRVQQFLDQVSIIEKQHTIYADIEKELSKCQNILQDLSHNYLYALAYCLEKKFDNMQQFESKLQLFKSNLPKVFINAAVIERMPSFLDQIFSQIAPETTFRNIPAPKENSVLDQLELLPLHSPVFAKEYSASVEIDYHMKSSSPFIVNFNDDTKVIDFLQFPTYLNLTKPQIFQKQLQISNQLPCNHQLVQIRTHVFLLGGILKDQDRYDAINCVFELDLLTLQLQLHSRMNEKRQDFGACASSENWIFVCGGSTNSNDGAPLKSLEGIDIKTKAWKVFAPCQIAAVGLTLVNVSNTHLLKIGGLDESDQEIKRIEVYDMAKNSWSFLSMMGAEGGKWEEIGSKHGAVQVNQSEVLLFGGRTGHLLVDDCWVLTLAGKQAVVKRAHSMNIRGEAKGPCLLNQGKLYSFIKMESEEVVLLTRSKDSWGQI